MKCTYTVRLFSGNYDCEYEQLSNSQFCQFHDANYWKEHAQEHDTEVRKIIDISMENRTSLFLVGFHIPEYSFPKNIYSELHFEFAYFENSIDFSHTLINGYANFYYTTFENVADFQFSHFVQVPIFYNTTFKEDAVFVETKFLAGANFYDAIFLKWANFINSVFGASSFLPGMRFFDRAIFTNSKFVGKTEMSRCEFTNATFSYVDFDGELEFSNVVFPKINFKDIKKQGFEIPIRFDYSIMRKRVRIMGRPETPIILEGVSFLGVNLQNVEFNNVTWLKPKRWWRKAIIDELTLKTKKNFEEVSDIYAQLRKNYETRLRFTEASNFFIGEVESTKKGLQKGTIREKFSSIPYSLYKYLAFYGESYFLPLAIWAPILIVIFFVIRDQTCYCAIKEECNFVGRVTDSLSAFFLFPRSEGLIDVSERVLSIPILGSAFIGLKRHFERRK